LSFLKREDFLRLLKTNAGKRAHIYPTSECPKPGIRTSSRKSVTVPTVQPSKKISAFKQKTALVNPKSTSLAKTKAAVTLKVLANFIRFNYLLK
jgi:hypothetical protein